MLEKLTGFIPAGGKGERLYPLTVTCPKPALLMGSGNKRLIDHSLQVIPNESNVVISVGFQGKVLTEYLCQKPFRQDTEILYDTSLSNIAGSMAQHIKEIERIFSDYVLVLPADHILKGLDIKRLLDEHISRNANITVLVTEPKKYGDYLDTDKGNVIGVSNQDQYSNIYSSTGIYLFKTSFLLSSIHQKLSQGWQGEECDLTKEIVFPSIQSGNVICHVLGRNCYWDDTGTLERYYQNNIRLSVGNNVISHTALIDECVDLDQVIVLDGARLHSRVKLKRVIVASGSEIRKESNVTEDEQLVVLYNNGDKKYVEMGKN